MENKSLCCCVCRCHVSFNDWFPFMLGVFLLIQLQNKMVGQNPQSLLAFSIAIFLSWECQPPLWGKVVEKIGPRLTGLLLAFFTELEPLMTVWAIHQNSICLLYLSYGFIGAWLRLGAAYVTTCINIIQMVSRQRGLANRG
ncbi:hypothetical protein N42HA_00141 [Lactococcus lactis]|nr:hypothetical protein [Lactococcus lactis]